MNAYPLWMHALALCLLCCLITTPALAWNQLPIPQINYAVTPYSQYIGSGDTISLDGSWSYDPDGWIIDYEWQVYKKNGSSWSYYGIQWGSPTSRRFTTPARYRLDLYVEDNDNEWSSSCDSCYVTAVDVTITSGDEYINYGGSDQADIYYSVLPNDPDLRCSSTLLIKDSSNNTIRTVSLGTGVGSQQTTWDGRRDNGSAAPTGQYTAVIQMTVAYGGPTFYSNSHFITVVNVVINSCEPYFGSPAGDFGESLDVSFTITPASIPDTHHVWLVVKNQSQVAIRSQNLGDTLGFRWASWDGLTDGGALAASGQYTVTIELRVDSSGYPVFSSSYSIWDVRADISKEGDYLEPLPGLIVPKDRAGDDAPDVLIGGITMSVAPTTNPPGLYVEVSVSDPNIVNVWDGTEWFHTSKVYYNPAVLPSLAVDGNVPGTTAITVRARAGSVSGPIVAQDHIDALVTDTTSRCPTGTTGTIWKPGTGDSFNGGDGGIFLGMTMTPNSQGYTITMLEDDSDLGFGGCTLDAYLGLPANSLLHVMGPPDADPGGHPVVYGTYNACNAWKGSTSLQLVQISGDSWYVRATPAWLRANFKPGLDATRAIVNWALGSSVSYRDDAGGRWRVGYEEDATADDQFVVTTQLLLERMNGTSQVYGGTRRTAGEALGGGGFPTGAYMDGNPWTTLCPAPVKSNALWPGCIIFDTYMDTTYSAQNAVIAITPGGSVTQQAWGGETGYGRFLLAFLRQNTTVRAVADFCRAGDKRMDGNRIASNGDNVEW